MGGESGIPSIKIHIILDKYLWVKCPHSKEKSYTKWLSKIIWERGVVGNMLPCHGRDCGIVTRGSRHSRILYLEVI